MQYSKMFGVIEMVSYWVENWEHILYSPDEFHDKEKIPVISQLCFGPLETCEYGIDGGNFYFENTELEGISEGDRYFKIISKEKFLDAVKNELWLCKKNAPQLLEQSARWFEDICGKFKLDSDQLSK